MKNVYIPSLEASDIYARLIRGSDLRMNYSGMIPYSLELIKMEKVLKKDEIVKVGTEEKPKYISNAVINVKFDKMLKSSKQIIKDTEKKLKKFNKNDEEYDEKEKKYINKLNKFITEAENGFKKYPENWREFGISELRKKLYTEGVKLVDKDGVVTDYVVYKRSSAKSRNGECLIIKKEYYDELISWSRMGMDLKEGVSIDFPSLLAYESLVGSSIQFTKTIDTKNIFMIEDVESTFPCMANVVRTNEKVEPKRLHSVLEKTTISNSIWDGQSLLHKDYFPEGKDMMLLRNHFYKSAAFRCDITKWLEDNIPSEYESLDDWMLEDMFGNLVPASSIHLISTPNSLKALKFKQFIEDGTNESMWNYWGKRVEEDGFEFGVVKTEKESKHKYNDELEHDENGQLYREMSYQTLNSLPCDKNDVFKMSEFERNYIMKLKNDVDFFVNHHLEKKKTNQNAHQMFIDLYKINKEIVQTKPFKDYRKRIIHDHVKYVKKGKIRLEGDLSVLCGNPILMLKKVIGKLDENNLEAELGRDEIHTTLFDDGEFVSGFRSPHTSQSNVLVAKVVHEEQISRYFNFGKNIVVVSSVGNPLLDKLSGSDFDSDCLLLLRNETLLERSRECQKFKIVKNELAASKAEYKLTMYDMFRVDDVLSGSTDEIGTITNTAQLLMSLYNDTQKNDLMQHLSVLTCLSGVAIDQAKKLYDIKMKDELKHIKGQFKLKKNKKGEDKYPLFWTAVSQSKKMKNKVMRYNTTMDHLNVIMNELDEGDAVSTIDINTLLEKQDYSKADRKQIKKIRGHIREMQGKIVEVFCDLPGDTDEVVEERNIILDNLKDKAVQKVEKLKIKPATMYSMLRFTEVKKKKDKEETEGNKKKKDKNNITIRLMNVLHKTHKETFLAAFKNSPH